MVAHELSSPLAAVRVLATVLVNKGLSPEDAARTLDAIEDQLDQLDRLVDDVAAVAGAERDDFIVCPRPVAVAKLLGDAAAFARTLSGEHPVTTEIAVEAAVLADPARIGQVLRNLLDNAAKHTPPGTPIELRARPDGERVWLGVVDRGPGITTDDQGRIFDKFGRGRTIADRKVPGVGLGLYLSQRIVRAHGSELTVASTLGEGTVFGFVLERAE
jgi:signal transduction histidine kinase